MLILAAILAVFVYGLIAPVLGALLPSYQLTGPQEGNLALCQALGLIVASLSAGPVIDLRGNKVGLVTGLTLIIVALFWAPNASGYGVLLFVYFILGIGGGIVVTGSNSLAGAVDPSRRASALNLVNLFFGLGGILTTYAASGLLEPRVLCYAIGTLTIIALIVNAVAKMPGPVGHSAFKPGDVPKLFSQPALLLLCLFLFLYVACEVGVWNWLKRYLISTQFDAATAGGIVSYGFALAILVGRVIVSRVLIRIPALTVTLVASILMTITTFMMLQVHSRTGVTVAVFCAGLAMAPMFPTILAITGDTFSRAAATALGIVITCGWIGLAVSSPIIGAMAAGNNYGRALLLLPLFSLVMVLVNLVLRPVLRRHVPA
ncbi:MAG: MFS transporter [Bryobacteraceae bacterium]